MRSGGDTPFFAERYIGHSSVT